MKSSYSDMYHPPKYWCGPCTHPNSSCLHTKDNSLQYTAKSDQEQFEDKEPKGLAWPPNSAYTNPIKHLLYDKPDSWRQTVNKTQRCVAPGGAISEP